MQYLSSGDMPVPSIHVPVAPPVSSRRSRREAAPQKVGNYLVSPLIKNIDGGWFASSVSIRSGSGSATTDRVLRLPRLFRCTAEAVAYARAEALRWIAAPLRPLPV